MTLLHGGIGDLWKGSLLKPDMAHVRYLDGCPTCEAQRKGHSSALGLDPETPAEFVYATTDREYARYYASRAVRGWLYEVELDPSSIEESKEDPFPTWRAHQARVVRVLEKRITLMMAERRDLFLRWGGSASEFESMLSRAARDYSPPHKQHSLIQSTSIGTGSRPGDDACQISTVQEGESNEIVYRK